MSRPEDQIVFEDLHGVQEDEKITVDLDAGTKDDGIERSPVEQTAEADDKDDDSIKFDDLRSADDDSADEQGDEDDAASKASEDDDYSKKVKARIEREQRAKRKAKQEADYWRQQAEKLAKDQYERDKTYLKRDIEQVDSEIESIQTDLERAIEEGQTKDQVRLTNRLTDLKAKKARSEVSLDNLSEGGDFPPFDDKITPEDRKSTKSKAEEWMDGHSDWYKQGGFERATRLANRIDREVYDEGYDPNTQEYFDELDRRIKEKMPELYDDLDAADSGGDDKKTERKRPTQSPVAGVSRQDSQHKGRGSKVELTEDDFATMRQFNLDPNDPEVLKEFARNKREAESGARR